MMELIPGLPAGCHVISQNKGPPAESLSKRDIRLLAPAGVRGGKNSREKNLSPFSILLSTLVLRSTAETGVFGEMDRGVLSMLSLREEPAELLGEDGTPLEDRDEAESSPENSILFLCTSSKFSAAISAISFH